MPQSDWPKPEIEALVQRLEPFRVIDGYGEDVVSDTIEAAIKQPFADVQAKGGWWPNALGILKHKRADAQRAQQRDQERHAELDAADQLGERVRSAILRRSADDVEPSIEPELLPESRSADAVLDEWAQAAFDKWARSPEAALEECKRRLGDKGCADAIARLKQIVRRDTYRDETLSMLRLFASLAPMLRQLKAKTFEASDAEARQAPDPSIGEALDDAYDLSQLVKGRNLCRKLMSWIQNEQAQHWLSNGLQLVETSEKLVVEVEAIEIERVAKSLLSVDPSIKPNTIVALEIASGREVPPASKEALKAMCDNWKKALQRARADNTGKIGRA